LKEVNPPIGGYTWCPAAGADLSSDSQYVQKGGTAERIASYFYNYYSAEPGTFFRIMLLNVKINDVTWIESIEIRKFLISYGP
jgi:hypothetical protein